MNLLCFYGKFYFGVHTSGYILNYLEYNLWSLVFQNIYLFINFSFTLVGGIYLG